MNLFQRLILLVLLAVLPAVAFGAYTVVELRRTQLAELDVEAQRLRDLLGAEQTRIVDGVRQLIDTMAVADAIRNGDMGSCQQLLDRMPLPFRMGTLAITDRQGVIRCVSDTRAMDTRIDQSTHVRLALQTGAFTVGDFTEAKSIGRLVWPFAVPYSDRLGMVGGVVTFTIDLDWLGDALTVKRLPANSSIILADRRGTVLASVPDGDRWRGKPLSPALLPLLAQAEPGLIEAPGLDGRPRIFAYSPLADGLRDTFLAVGLDKEARLAPINRATRWGVALLVAGLLAAAAAAWFGGRRFIVRPLEALGAAAARWRDGDLAVRVDMGAGTPETRRLGHTFNEMAAGLEERERLRAARLAAEEALRASEARYRGLVESQSDMVLRLTDDGIIVFANDTTARLLGKAPEDLPGSPWAAFIHPDSVDATDEAIGRIMMPPHPRTAVENRMLTIDGPRWFAWEGYAVFDSDGHFSEVQAVGRDIDRRRATEQALAAAKEAAEGANQAKSRFLAAASHDLRQPVQSLLLFMGVLKDRLTQEPTAAAALSAMEQSLDALRLLLDSLLDISRLDAGLIEPQPVDMPVTQLLDRFAAEYGPRAAALGLRFRVVRSTLAVHSDPALLERILRNLIENALRYTRSGGVLIGCRRCGGRVRIMVADTGIGIAGERVDDIFEEFYQLGNPERDRSKGLGLGLAVVRRLSRLLGHGVEVHSRVGRGSVFSLDVPLVRRPPRFDPPAAPAASGERHGLVLVIDDEVLVRLGLQTMLESWGHTVLVAGSVGEALQRVEECRRAPDAILADYRLRDGETGIQAIRMIEERFGACPPAAMITGDTAPERLAEARASGIQMLHKPVVAVELRKAIASMLASPHRQNGEALTGG
ncbi:ATP-binding protein [Azospirillum sp. sgz301742]